MAQEEVETQEEPETASSAATGSVKLNPKRLLTLSGVIDESMFGQANRLIELADLDSDPIDIVIASPGGYISHGLMFIQAMTEVKKKGIVIRCYVTSLAASMAFNIFTQCSERYALPYATLLFHSPRISGQFTIDAQGARQLSAGLNELEKLLLSMILPVMGINQHSGQWFAHSYNTERLFLATELETENPVKWYVVVARIEGYPGTFPAPYGPSSGANDLRRARIAPSIKEAGR